MLPKKKQNHEARPSRGTARRGEKQTMTEDTTTPEDCDIWKKKKKTHTQKNNNIYYENTPIQIFKYIENFTTKNWKFSDKNSDIFHISAQNIDCGYSLEPPRRGLALRLQ